MNVKFTRRNAHVPSNIIKMSVQNVNYEINKVKGPARIFEEIFSFSNVDSIWLSPSQGEAVLEMSQPFDTQGKIYLPAIVDEETMWICSDDNFTELHVMIDAFEYFEVL